LVKQLLEKKVCFVYEELKEAYRPKEEKIVTLHPRCDDEDTLAAVFDQIQGAPKQTEALLAFLHLHKTEGLVRQADLQKKAGVSAAVVKALADKNILLIQKQITDRIPPLKGEINIKFTLNNIQQQAYDQIRKLYDNKPVVLLHGVTSSGKTMLYIKLIEEFLQKGKQVLYLLPEIALTAQIIRRLQKHFGDQIGIYHSRFNNNERVEIWNKVKTGEYKVILGARSALLLPFKELGCIILDEEHDASYKQQDPAPRYHARDAAIYYAGLSGAKVLLGSATPSLESFYNAQMGKYGLVQLSERYGGMKMPDIAVVDMKLARQNNEAITRYLSPALKESMKQVLAEDKQVILFQNRRGYAPMIACNACGWIPHCKNCDVSLTYHKFHHRLHCHYCGHQYPVPVVCEACGSVKLTNRSFGTERIEDDLATVFPDMRVARMDLDSIRNKEAHHKLIELFEKRRIDILVGTQMIVKGLDFDHVKLVGILSADNLLSYPDFRVHERAFQLMEQVSGRAGRREERGKVIIQAVNTAHPVLDFVMRHDYVGFYQSELAERERFFYPPFSRLIRILLKHKKQEVVREAAQALSGELQQLFGDTLLGPSVPPVGRIRNYYLMEFLVKLPRQSKRNDQAKALILEKMNWLQAQQPFRRIMIIPDVDCI
jgi:primosomal protein N' (replication factor Y)